MLFFAYVPLNASDSSIERKKFTNIHLGKLIKFGKNGLGIIRKLLEHTNGPLGFHTSVLTDMVEPFGMESDQESNCISGSLSISHSQNDLYHITITTNGKNLQITILDNSLLHDQEMHLTARSRVWSNRANRGLPPLF
ncbi:Cation channel sperm-associated auxiliary subunit beta [Lemmus lemmus]